jgi:hypothetical protein
VIFRAEGVELELQQQILAHHNDPETQRLGEFFRRAESDPDATLLTIQSWLEPVKSTRPERVFLRARALPVFRFEHRTNNSPRFQAITHAATDALKSPPAGSALDSLSVARLKELTE